MTKWVYLFDEGNKDMRDLLGGKGAGLAEMTHAGLPVPPGFTITTEACNAYFRAGKQFPEGMWDQTLDGAQEGRRSRPAKSSAIPSNPLLVSVRSGAKFSMPGMMDTVLNVGLNADNAARHRHADRQRAICLGRLPPPDPDVRAHRQGHRRRKVRAHPGQVQGQDRRARRTPT